MDIKQVITATITSCLPGTLGLAAVLLCSTSHALPPEFTATYQAETYGMVVAQATYTLKHKPNGISFSQHSEPVGLASIFTDDALDEFSELSLHGNQLLLDEYSYIQKGDDKNRNIQLTIKWEQTEDQELKGNISGVNSGTPVQLVTDRPVWDTLSFQIPVMLTTRKNNPPQEHTILVKGTLKTYMFITHDTEEININGQVINSIKIERRDNDKDKPMFFWVAPELGNLPVKIEKWKKNKPGITMLLKDAVIVSDRTVQFHAGEDPDDDFD